MVTRPQIEKLNARIEALADAIASPNDGTDVVYAWKERDETDEHVLVRIYQEHHEAQRARQVIVFSWLSPSLEALELRGPEDFEAAFATAKQRNAQALLALDNPLTWIYRSRITALAASSRLPAMYATREYPDAGGLMSYGVSLVHLFRRFATFVDKILKGAKPADLPVEQPTKFELVINVKVAKALGLTLPHLLLTLADELIE